MDLEAYLGPLRKWWWLLVIASVVAAVSSYLVTRQQPPVYQARTTLVIGRSVFVPNPTSSDFWLGQQLATFYADYARREPVRNSTMTALGLRWLPEYYAAAVPNSQLIEIVVTDTSPERAQAVANELANQLILQSPTSRESQALEHQDFVQQQLYNLEAEINQTMEEMAAKQEELGELFSARQIADAEADLSALETKLTTLQTNYAALLANSEQGASNTLSVIESASLPRRQIGPQTQMIVLLTTAIGLFLAAGAAYLIEYLDDTLKTKEDIDRVVNLPVIGMIVEVKRDEASGAYVAKQPRSVVADAYRSLRTNLEFASVDKPLKTIYVSSASMAEGKTAIAINLAVVMAQSGKRVILLDADLRRPNVDHSLGLPNRVGLSDVFRGQVEIEDAFTQWDVPNVRVMVSGGVPPNPADLLGSKKMDSVLDALQAEADIVIVDGPPFLVADASVLANKVDGVLLVVRHGYTRRESLKIAIEKLNQAGANILGVVLNRVPRSSYRLYGSYNYETYYTATDEETRDEIQDLPEDPESPRGNAIANLLTGYSRQVRHKLQEFRGDSPAVVEPVEAVRALRNDGKETADVIAAIADEPTGQAAVQADASGAVENTQTSEVNLLSLTEPAQAEPDVALELESMKNGSDSAASSDSQGAAGGKPDAVVDTADPKHEPDTATSVELKAVDLGETNVGDPDAGEVPERPRGRSSRTRKR